MITEALQHFRGVGPVRLAQLHEAGVRSWHDALAAPEHLAPWLRREIVEESERCLQALADDNVQYFVANLCAKDKWRVLHQYHDRASFFDIETTGLEYDDTITVIVCWHKNQLHTFVEHENLDDFLDLLDDIELLASFNGSTFDVPRVLDAFHIPELPCPHLDLRWPCYHRDLQGGLKQVVSQLGIDRPPDLQDVDGGVAVELWAMWQDHQNHDARDQLIRYCAADVLLLLPLADELARRQPRIASELWSHLPNVDSPPIATDPVTPGQAVAAKMFGQGSPSMLRTRRRTG
ncbi:MAG: ribonuclease H-like domain-containing protein [Fuerstiella sp.]|nr:ribonuclease H-like domain-containing protein [Fuerstiella sp.]